MIDVVKEPSDVRFDDPPVFPVIERFAEFLGRVARTAFGPVSDAFVGEVVFPAGLEEVLRYFLRLGYDCGQSRP